MSSEPRSQRVTASKNYCNVFYPFSFYTTDFNLIAYLICNHRLKEKRSRNLARLPYLNTFRFGAETSDDEEAGNVFRKIMSGDELELSYSSSEFDKVHSESENGIVPFLYEPL